MIKVKDWSIIKGALDSRQIPCDWVDLGHAYWIIVVDAYFQLEMFLNKKEPASADQVDFETNYKPLGNISKTDFEGNVLSRTKASRKGWHYQLHFIGIKTSVSSSGVHNKDHLGNDLGFTTYKMFKSDGTETTNPSEAVKTQVDWTPGHDIEVIAGLLTQSVAPANDCYVWVVAAPGIMDIPFLQGGANLKLSGINGKVDADGKAAKYLPYANPIPGTNTFRIIATHGLALNTEFQIAFGIFKA